METQPHTDTTAGAWLERHQETGATTDEALAFFDRLPAMGLDDMRGHWRGSGLHTGHPLDGLLEAFGWYGKQFDGPESVHPLLFKTRGGVADVNPRFMPVGLMTKLPARYARPLGPVFSAVLGLLRTREPACQWPTETDPPWPRESDPPVGVLSTTHRVSAAASLASWPRGVFAVAATTVAIGC